MEEAVMPRLEILKFLFTATFAAFLLNTSGCTTSVESMPLKKYSTVELKDVVPQGIVYQLPTTALDYEVKYRLVNCEPFQIDLHDSTVTPVTVVDQSLESTFVIDPREMTNWLKTVDEAKVELNNGLLSIVTYEVDDKSRGALSQLAKVALRFGTVSTPGAPNLSAIADTKFEFVDGDTSVSICKDEFGGSNGYLDKANKTKEKIIALKGTFIAAQTAFKKNPTIENGKNLEKAKADLNKEKAKYSALIEGKLTYTHKERFYPILPGPTPGILYKHTPTIPRDLIVLWINVDSADTTRIDNIQTKLLDMIGIDIVIKGKATNTYSKADTYDGIYYRSPTIHQLLAQRTNNPVSPLSSKMVSFFQFGPLAAIPISNGLFQNNRYSIIFNDDGSLKSFEYKEKRARLEEGLTALDETSGILEDSEKSAIEKETALLKAEKERTDAEKELLESQGELEDVKNP